MFNYLCDTYIPDSGQAHTVQGELLRCIKRLFDESFRNGNGNWDEGYEIMVKYLEDILTNSGIFDDSTISTIKQQLKVIADFENVPLVNNPYDFIADRVVDFCDVNREPIDRKINPKLKR